MGMFLNPDNNAFQMATNSQIYVDKTNRIRFTNSVLNSRIIKKTKEHYCTIEELNKDS